MPTQAVALDQRESVGWRPDLDLSVIRIDYPVTRYVLPLVFDPLGEPIGPFGGRAQHLNHQQQSLDPAPVQAADLSKRRHEDVRLNQRIGSPRDVGPGPEHM